MYTMPEMGRQSMEYIIFHTFPRHSIECLRGKPAEYGIGLFPPNIVPGSLFGRVEARALAAVG